MNSGVFSKRIKDAQIVLRSATDVARLDFIVQKSVSYLDLKLRSNLRTSDFLYSFCVSCRPKCYANFVNTEEKCRLFFAPRRRLFYTLNLDLPKGRERSLKDDVVPRYFPHMSCCVNRHIADITPVYEFHATCLLNFIEYALHKKKMRKERLLKWMTKPPFSELKLLSNLDMRIASKFIDCFRPQVTDSELFSDFIKQIDVTEYMEEYEQPEILEFLLHNARLHGNKKLKEHLDHHCDLISHCICEKHYLNIGPTLKYISNSRPTIKYRCVEWFLDDILERTDVHRNIQSIADKVLMTKTRLYLWLQVIWVYRGSRRGLEEAGSKALRLIWSSVQEPFLSSGELKILESEFSEERLSNVFDFYVAAIGESYENFEPRSLEHLCRAALRETFEKNNLWIPDSISRLGLPKSLRAFLNLEETYAV